MPSKMRCIPLHCFMEITTPLCLQGVNGYCGRSESVFQLPKIIPATHVSFYLYPLLNDISKKGGKVIIPTYINTEINSSRSFVLSGSILRKKKRADSPESAEKFTINLLTILYIFPIQYYIFHHNLDN